MTRPRIVDAFCFNDELDMLECRLTEIGDIVDHIVLVEANVTHRNDPKPYHYLDNADRFARWADKITPVQVTGLPDDPDPWTREHAQREGIADGLALLDLDDHDIVMQSDVDEIPRRLHARNVRPTGLVVFGMRFHPFAVDWLHPDVWRGTVAGRASTIRQIGPRPFAHMRHCRFTAPMPPHMVDAGWHFSWVGGTEYTNRKLRSFAHHEIVDRSAQPMSEDAYRRHGWHVDGARLQPVDVDNTWPRWIVDGHAPADWFRPQ